MSYTYRLADNNDLELFINLDKLMRLEDPNMCSEYDENLYRENWFRYPIDSYDFGDIILCLNENQIIGRVDLMYERSYMNFSLVGYVDWIYVLPAYRGKGVGKRLLAEAEKHFKHKGCFKYYLFVAENEQAKKFYDKTDLVIEVIKTAQKKIN